MLITDVLFIVYLQSTKMIVKLRESHIAKLERLRKKEQQDESHEEDSKDREIVSIHPPPLISTNNVRFHCQIFVRQGVSYARKMRTIIYTVCSNLYCIYDEIHPSVFTVLTVISILCLCFKLVSDLFCSKFCEKK